MSASAELTIRNRISVSRTAHPIEHAREQAATSLRSASTEKSSRELKVESTPSIVGGKLNEIALSTTTTGGSFMAQNNINENSAAQPFSF
jgi:hypothetical protein